MRTVIASLVLLASLVAAPRLGRAEDPGLELGFSTLAAVSNIFYTPAKLVVAVVGLAAGGVAGVLTGGDQRSAYAFWVPMAGGDYFLTADQMDGAQPVRFFGHDYTDRPSVYGVAHQGSAAYDARYERRRRAY